MKLLTQEIINTLPKIYEQDGTCFGLVQGHEEELGYFNIHELEMLKLNDGLHIQRDLDFIPTTLQEIKEKHPTK